jgi:diguanylate cyclase (GGDEF)-like protein/hemerythrin-like metal-binding protein/PAS domain S-box-containing protein
MVEHAEELHILILEDEPTDAELAVERLREDGLIFTCLRVDKEATFIQALQQFSPDIVLADYRLPAYNGAAALEYTRLHYPNIPLIMVTGALGEEAAIDLIKQGASDYVLKNNLLRLTPAIRRALSDVQAELQRRAAEENYHAMFENSPFDMHEIDLEGRLVAMNQAGLGMLGLKHEHEIIGTCYLDLVDVLDRERIGALFANAKSGTACHFEYKTSNGERLCKSCFVPLRNSQNIVENLMGITEDITDARQAEIRTSYLASHDRLTELPNRELFFDRLSQAISHAKRKSERIAIFFLDLDGFKMVNDQYGHDAGDIVLKMAAQRLQSCTRDMDTVARLGGDEFAIILNEMGNAEDASVFAEKIIRSISIPIAIREAQAGVGVSIGIAIYPLNGNELDRLLNAADTAMYESKARGKNCYTFFNQLSTAQSLSEPWITIDPSMRMGLPDIDQQHEHIIHFINELNGALKRPDQIEVISGQLDELIKLLKAHFTKEELSMQNSAYPEIARHRQQHKELLDDLAHRKNKFTEGGELVVLQSFKDWYLQHILNFDKPLADFLVRQGIK